MMKITIEHLGNKVTVEDEGAHDITDAIDRSYGESPA